MSDDLLLSLVNDVIAAAKADATRAAEIYADAAAQFAQTASEVQASGDHALAAKIEGWSAEFAARAEAADSGPATTNDFDEAERDRAQAHRDVGHLDDLEIEARTREIAAERDRTPRVSIAPSSVDRDTALGRSARIKFDPTEAEKFQGVKTTETVVLWPGPKSEAQAVTVDIGVFEFPTIGQFVSCRPYAIVTFGVDGFRTSVKVDVARGQRFTVPANYVDVLVGMGPPAPGIPSGTMVVGAKIAFFGATSVSPVVCTEYVDALALLGTTTIVIPQQAQFLLPVQTTATPGSTYRLEFYGTSTADKQFSREVTVGQTFDPIPLGGSARQIILTSLSGPATSSFQFPFQIAL